MNREQLEAQLVEVQAQLDAIKAELAKPEKASSLLNKPEPGSSSDYWALSGDGTSSLQKDGWCASNADPSIYQHGNIFQSAELATAYADAIETMLLLRHQPGTAPAHDHKQWVIDLKEDGMVDYWDGADYKYRFISPCFISCEAARAAIKAIGRERIQRMFNTLHHVGV